MSRQLVGLVGWLALSFLVAAVGALAAADSSAFYAQLDRPSWAPPASWFGPVWSLLYGLMAIAAWLVWREPRQPGRRSALILYVVQLGFNALWSWLFFAWRLGGLAFLDVIILLALIAITLVAFWRVSWLAGVLFLPYFAWVGFATALTWSIWQSNPMLLK